MNLEYIRMDDYDKKHKISNKNLFCYSKSQINELFPNKDYYIIGEITGKEYSEQKGSANRFIYKGDEYALYENKGKSRLIYRRVGYICVGEGKFVTVLKNRLPFLIILLFLLVGIGVASYVLFGNLNTTPSDPAPAMLNPLPEIDPYVSVIEEKDENDKNENVNSSNNGGSVSMVYTLKAKLNLTTKKIDMVFENPKSSNHSVTVELYLESPDNKVLIGKSKLVKPGYGINNLDFITDSAVLKEGGYKGYYKVQYYNDSTGERAIVESEIADVDIIVSN